MKSSDWFHCSCYKTLKSWCSSHMLAALKAPAAQMKIISRRQRRRNSPYLVVINVNLSLKFPFLEEAGVCSDVTADEELTGNVSSESQLVFLLFCIQFSGGCSSMWGNLSRQTAAWRETETFKGKNNNVKCPASERIRSKLTWVNPCSSSDTDSHIVKVKAHRGRPVLTVKRPPEPSVPTETAACSWTMLLVLFMVHYFL